MNDTVAWDNAYPDNAYSSALQVMTTDLYILVWIYQCDIHKKANPMLDAL